MRKKKKEPDSACALRSAAAAVGVNSIAGMAQLTGINKTTLQRRMQNIATMTVGELSLIVNEFPCSDETIGKIIREVYR